MARRVRKVSDFASIVAVMLDNDDKADDGRPLEVVDGAAARLMVMANPYAFNSESKMASHTGKPNCQTHSVHESRQKSTCNSALAACRAALKIRTRSLPLCGSATAQTFPFMSI